MNKSSLSDIFSSIQPSLQKIEDEMCLFEDTLRTITFSALNSIDFRLSDGKKLRAALLLFSTGQTTKSPDMLTSAKAVEMLHYASLVHDDILDHEQDRRGAKPLYNQLSLKKAILLGDYILAQALLNIPESIYIKTNQALLSIISEMCVGEFIQMTMKESSLALDKYQQTYLDVNYKKTALLFGKACFIGSLFNNSLTDSDRLALQSFGENFGMAFQLRDDTQEIIEQLANPNYNRELDAAQGILTLPYLIYAETILGLKTSEEFSKFNNSLKDSSTLAKLNQELQTNNIFEKVNEVILSYLNKAKSALQAIDPAYSKNLLAVADCFAHIKVQ